MIVAIAVVVALFLVIAATRPSAYRVERAAEVAAPAERVFATLDNVDHLAEIFMLFGEPVAKLVQAGKATLTVEDRVPFEKLTTKLDIVSPMKSTSTTVLDLANTPSGSRVTWSMSGHHNFIGKALRVLVNTDRMLATDLDKGLAQLKTVVEATRRRGA